MNFLKNAVNKAKESTTASPMGNPLVNQKPQLPGVKPPVGKPPLPGVKPPIPGKMPPKPPVKPVIDKEVEVKPEAVVQPTVEETPVVEVVKVAEEAVKEAKQEQEVEVKPEKKKRTSSRKKKEDKDDSNIKETVNVEVKNYSSEGSFAECVDAVSSQFIDEEWITLKDQLSQKTVEIAIGSDMTKAQIHDLLSQLASLRDSIFVMHNDAKTLYDSLTAKDDGLIDRVKRLNAKGTNSEERKVSGTLAAMSYVSQKGGFQVNLYEVLDEARQRYNFLKSTMETIEYKKSVLLTMLSSLKMEK